MNPFHYQRATDVTGAIRAISPKAKFLAGGTNLIDLIKNGVETPVALIDINRVDLVAIEAQSDGGLRVGALARNSDTANHPAVRQHYPYTFASHSLGSLSAVAESCYQRRERHATDAVSVLHGHWISAV
jgi:CO/xanthine dehydrogenase FAD-binding subunit